jgi:hypothetical protein
MNRDDIVRMAREAGFESNSLGMTYTSGSLSNLLERFASLVAAAEREACAKVCEEATAAWTQHLYNDGCMNCAAAIRARGKE